MLESSFRFKGGRDYLHSTSVFDAIVDESGSQPTSIDFVFNHRTACQPIFSTEIQNRDRQALIGSWRDSKREIFILEGTTPIDERVPYDEGAIASRCMISNGSVYAPIDIGGHSFIEICVAAYKHLLQIHLGDGHAKYAFARITLQRIPETDFAIRYARKIGGEFYQGDIIADESIGRIFFGVWT